MDNSNYTTGTNPYDSGYSYQENNQPKRTLVRIALLIVGIAVVWALYAFISTIISHRSMGAVQINVAKDVQVEVLPSGNGKSKVLGTGTHKAWLKPGDYQVIATTGNSGASTVVTVVKRKLSTVNLDHLQKVAPHAQLAHYTAQDIYVSPDSKSLYFLNAPENLLYTIALGTSTARPYLIDKAYQVGQVGWVSPTQFFTDVASTWTYINGNTSTPLKYNGQSAAPGLMSFSPSGAYAYLTDKNDIVRATSPSAAPQKIGSIETGRSEAGGEESALPAVAPNGDVLVYGAGTDGKSEPTRLYQNGQALKLPGVPDGIASVQWSTDSSKFSYVASDGLFVYDLTSKSITKVFVQQPDSTTAVLWVNPTTFIYAGQGNIWRYQTDSKNVISDMTASYSGKFSDFDEPFTLAPDGQTVYYSTQSSGGKGGYINSIIPNYNSLPQDQRTELLATQKAAMPHAAPSYSGTDTLLDYITPDQLDVIKSSLDKFFNDQRIFPNKVEVTKLNPIPHDPEGTGDRAYFNLETTSGKTQKTFYTQLDYFGPSSVHLKIWDQDGKQVYDSGELSTMSS